MKKNKTTNYFANKKSLDFQGSFRLYGKLFG